MDILMSKWRENWRFSVVSDIQALFTHATVFGGLCKKRHLMFTVGYGNV